MNLPSHFCRTLIKNKGILKYKLKMLGKLVLKEFDREVLKEFALELMQKMLSCKQNL